MESLFYALGLSGLFASRAFLPSFLASCALRWGADFPLLHDIPFLGEIPNAAPTWFTHDYTILALGILSFVEILSDKDPHAREIMGYLEKYTKPILAALTMMGVLSLKDATFIKTITLYTSDFLEMVSTATAASFTYLLTSLRTAILSPLREADEDDETQIQFMLSWVDDFWVIAGLFIFLVFPLFVGIIVGVFFLFLLLLKKRMEKKEEQQKITCPSCGTIHLKSAITCPSCKIPNKKVHSIGVWGTAIDSLAHNLKLHALDLASKKRCPKCASRLEERSVKQSCVICAHQPFAEPAFQEEYLNHQSGKVLSTLLVVGIFGMIPFLGAIMGIIYYRLVLVAPFRRYFSFSQAFFTKWLLRIVLLILLILQLIPLIGALPLIVMASLNYHFYRKKFVRSLSS